MQKKIKKQINKTEHKIKHEKRNPVAKYMNDVCKPSRMRDRKSDYSRKNKHEALDGDQWK